MMIVVSSIVLIVASEAHQATLSDQGNRAYFAANAGLEEGIYKIKTALNVTDPNCNQGCQLDKIEGSCLPHTAFSTDLDDSCLYLSRKNTTLTGSIERDGIPVQIDLSGVDAAKVEISWVSGSDAKIDLAALPATFAAGGNWGAAPAVIEATTIRFKPDGGGLFDPTDLTQLQTVKNVFVPSNAAISTLSDYTNPARRTSPYFSGCSAPTLPGSGYNCKQIIDYTADGGSYKHILVLGARYNGTHYSIKVRNSGGSYITNVPDQYETIDVTAKSGTVYRRARSKVAVFKGTASLDYAIFSDQDICKDFQLRDSKSGSSGANVGSCPF